MLTIAAVIKALEQKFPFNLAASWDNSGLQVGSGSRSVTKVITALDCTSDVVKKAEQEGAELIITHHPLIFSGFKSINYDHPAGHLLQRLCRQGISVYSFHTNLDRAPEGLNSFLAARLGLENPKVFGDLYKEPFYKLVVYVPVSHLSPVREALGNAGAGHIGNYSHCTFAARGEGTFLPGGDTNPYLGSPGNLEQVDEYRLESIVAGPQLNSCLQAIMAVHPYEEVAYEVYRLEQPTAGYGYGRMGLLSAPLTLSQLADKVKGQFDLDFVRIVGQKDRLVERVAVVSGSGAGLIAEAKATGAEVLITGDVKYHEAQEAVSRGLSLIDAGHDGLERSAVELLSRELKHTFSDELVVLAHYEDIIFTIG